jgi:acetate kinase
MTRAVLTLNAGSSSLKVALFPAHGDAIIASGLADRIGTEGVLKLKHADGTPLSVAAGDLTTHHGAMCAAIDSFRLAFPDLS